MHFEPLINFLLHIRSNFRIRSVSILKINTWVAANHLPNVNRNRYHDSIVARLKLRSFEFKIHVIFVKGLVVEMEITAVRNGGFGRHLTFSFVLSLSKSRRFPPEVAELTVCSRDRSREPTELQSFSSIEF